MFKILKDNKIIGISESTPSLLDNYEIIEVDEDINSYVQVNGEYVLKTDSKAIKLANEQRIVELKQFLADTDYVANKMIEATDEQELQDLREKYADVLAKRREARVEINKLGN